MAARRVSPALKSFGAEVTRVREDAGITRTALADLVAVTPSYVSQVESGNTRCRRDFAERLDKALGTGRVLREAWEELLQKAKYPKWFADYHEAEASAVLLRAYEATFIYGLFQTEPYVRSLLTAEDDVEGRLRRQKMALEATTPPTINVVLSESVLHRCVGDQLVMLGQLERLEEISHWPNVSLQVAPTAYYRGVSGSFNIATQATGEDLLYMETATGGVTSNESDEITAVIGSFGLLQANALSTHDSRAHIRKVMTGVEKMMTPPWRKSHHSDDKGGACVEIAPFPDGVGVRDSTDPDGPKLVLNRNAFRSLVNELKQR